MYFPPPLSCHYAGTVDGYNGDKLGGYFYHVSYDDGDEQDHTWREVQLGIQWYETGGYINAPHDEPLPTGPISSAGGAVWALTEETELRPRMPGLTDHYKSTDGAGG